MELREALSQIATIRDQIARTETFEGYRSVTVASSSVLAFGAAAVQSIWIPDPGGHLEGYLQLWVTVAALSALAAAIEMFVRCRRASSEAAVRLTRIAVEQFLPSVAAGALLTTVITRCAVETAWMLPGLWSIVFGLGVFASARLLPRPVFFVAAYYVAAGAVCLALGKSTIPLSPWLMVLTFGVGQLAAAAVLYWSLERRNVPAR